MGELFIHCQRGEASGSSLSINNAVVTLGASNTYDGTEKTQLVSSVVINGNTLVEDDDYVVVNNKATTAGAHTLRVMGVMNYTGSKNVEFTIAKATGSVSVSPSALSVSGAGSSETAALTVVGDGAVSVSTDDASVATAAVSGNTVTVTCVGGGTATITVTLAAGTNYTGATATIGVTCVLAQTFGVSWAKTSSTALSRTDDAALFTDPVPAIGTGTGSSPFDNILPWSGMVKETIDGNVMVKIPKFWYKWTDASGSLKLQIANGPLEGFHTSPAHADRGDGKGERDYVYIGRYHCASDYKSKTGVKPVANITRATARSGCKNLGSGYYQLDYAMWWTVRMLYLVEFANWDSQAKIGYGCGDNSATHNSGYSDTAQYHTGTMQSSRTTYGKGVQYRYIEDPWGNVRDWCDGIVMSSNAPYVSNNPANYGDSTTNHTKVSNGVSTSNEISGWAVPSVSGLEWALYPSSTVSNSNYDTYCADRVYTYSSSVVVYVGGYYYQYRNCGLFYSYMSGASSSSGSIGARLSYLP